MKHIVFSLLGNTLGLYIASLFIQGFTIAPGTFNFMLVAGLLTLLNLLIRPLVKLVVFPLILITFGLFSLVVNAGMLALLDFLSEGITISGLVSLFLATLIITGANLVARVAEKSN